MGAEQIDVYKRQEVGNEAEVNTGYIWVTQENMEEESIQNMLYE